jgi:ATP-dependent Clp protease ATP-binding subunit ClpC
MSETKKNNKEEKASVLDNFSINLTEKARNGELDPVIGREREIERACQTLSRRKKNNLLITGNPGVGKTALVEGIAQRIVQKKVSYLLQNKEIYMLDIASLVAGTKYRGQFEERMKAVMDEVTKNDNYIIFMDEIHTALGAGGASGSLDAANMLKPALSRGEFQCIGATTLDEYREHIEKDGALNRRFQRLDMDDPSEEETVLIMKQLKDKYEDFHNVIYPDEIIKKMPNLAVKYINDRHLPDSAIDLMDECGAKVQINSVKVGEKITKLEEQLEELQEEKMKLVRKCLKTSNWEPIQEFKKKYDDLEDTLLNETMAFEEELKNRKKLEITEKDFLEVLSLISNIPLDKLKSQGKEVLNLIKDMFEKYLIGQDDAVKEVLQVLKRNTIGLSNPDRPIAVFLFMGPTGVGKTQLAKLLSDGWFNRDMIRVDMSEYMEKFSVSKLAGSPPGYVGYDKGGDLTEKVRRNPYSLVLLDEVEKAHPDVFNQFLQVFDDGHMTDGNGRKVNFKNTIIIMTSNLGVRQSQESGIGFTANSEKNKRDKIERSAMDAAKKHFPPELLNRIDKIVVFNELSKKDITTILDIDLEKVKTLLTERNIKLRVGTKVKEVIVENGYDSNFGARPLARAVDKYVKDVVTDFILEQDEEIKDCTLSLKWDDKKEKVVVTKI